MKDKNLFELGKLAQQGNDMAMLEIIERKKKMIKKYSFGDEDRYQFIILKLIEGIKRYNFEKNYKVWVDFRWLTHCIYNEGQILRKHYIEKDR